MMLNKITRQDIEDALDALTPAGKGATCWYKKLAETEEGTGLYFVVGWSESVDNPDDASANGYYDADYGTICTKIAYQHSNNAMQSDYDMDWLQPYDNETGDVYDTSSMLSNEPSQWGHIAKVSNSDAKDIWTMFGETGELDLMESKQSKEACTKKEGCKSSMQKKMESLKKVERRMSASFYVGHPLKNTDLEWLYGDVFETSMRRKVKVTTDKNDVITSAEYVRESNKSEAYTDTIKVSTEDIVVEITECNTGSSDGRSFSVVTPTIGMKYSLEEFKDMVQGMVEDCSGFVDYSRDGSEIVAVVNAPSEDYNSIDDYESVAYIRGIVGVVSTSIEGVVDYLAE